MSIVDIHLPFLVIMSLWLVHFQDIFSTWITLNLYMFRTQIISWYTCVRLNQTLKILLILLLKGKANALCFINAVTLLVLSHLLFSKRAVWKSVPRLCTGEQQCDYRGTDSLNIIYSSCDPERTASQWPHAVLKQWKCGINQNQCTIVLNE